MLAIGFTFDPQGLSGAGSDVVTDAVAFDWAVDNALAVGGNAAIANFLSGSGSTSLVTLIQTRLAAVLGEEGPVNPAGLNQDYEFTLVGRIPLQVNGATGNQGNGFAAFGNTVGDTYLELYVDTTPDVNTLAGAGYNDTTGTAGALDPDAKLVLSAELTSVSAAFRTFPTTSALDRFATNNFPSLFSHRGSGDFDLRANVRFVDSAYFPDLQPNDSVLVSLALNGNLSTPFVQANPAQRFLTAATTTAARIGPTLAGAGNPSHAITGIGTLNGAAVGSGGGPSFQQQFDANSSFDRQALQAGIDIEKATNGQDADNPTGPLLPVGSTATFTYVVRNTGDVPLAGVVVVDDAGTPGMPGDDFQPTFSGGDANANGLLDPDEVWTYMATAIVTAGQYANISTVTGTPPAGLPPQTDSDPSHHFGVEAGIDIEKATNGQDADNPTGPLLPVGSMATFTYEVRNTGNVPLANVVVIDDAGTPNFPGDDFVPTFTGGDANTNGLLDPREVWMYAATRSVTAGQYANISVVTGTPTDPIGVILPDLPPQTDSDPSHHFGALAGIDIEKATNGQDADTPTGPVLPVGSTATFTYEVRNTGNVPLADVVVVDDAGTPGGLADDFQPVFSGGDANANGLLDPGEVWTYTATAIVTAGQYANIGTVTGIPPAGLPPQTDSDPSHHFGATRPVIVITPDKGNASLPYVHIVDQQTGELINRFLAYDESFRGGVRAATGNVSGGSELEIVTAPGRGHSPLVKVFDQSGNVLREFLAFSSTYTGGVDVAVGDVDGDGRNDIVASMSYNGSAVAVFRNTGTSFVPYKSVFYPFGSSFKGGVAVEAADMGTFSNGAVNNADQLDRKAEIIVANESGMRAAVQVYEYSGPTARVVRSYQPFLGTDAAFYYGFYGGLSLDVARVNDDAIPDIIVGAGNRGRSKVQVIDGLNRSLISDFVAYSASETSSYNAPVRVAAVDLDGDGLTDRVMTAQGSDGTTRAIRSFQPLTGALVDEFFETHPDFGGAYFVTDL